MTFDRALCTLHSLHLVPTRNSESEVPHTTTVYPIFAGAMENDNQKNATFEKREL